MIHRLSLWSVLLATCMLASCVRIAEVRERRPILRPLRTTVGALVAIEREIAEGLKRSGKEPLAAAGDYLTAAQAAGDQLMRDPTDKDAADSYNYALSRLFAVIRDAKLDPWTKPLTVPAEGGDYTLYAPADPSKGKRWNPALYEFTPADQFEVGGTYVKERTVREGFGAPLVAVGREMDKEARADFSLPRMYYGVTAIVTFSGRNAKITFYDPLATETVTAGGHTFPLAADFTVPIAVMLASTNTQQMGIGRLLKPEKFADTARIARLQPYDPDKTVVLVIHGLNSSPATYAPLINHLRADEAIRRNYQFWFYSYPSGYPYPHSAAILRQELDAIEKRFPLKSKMVVIGHSMGGCISRLLITDVGDELWMKTLGKPPAEVDMPAESKKLIEDALIFQHRPEVGRVIFICAPLRGADMASGFAGRLGSRLIKAPASIARASKSAVKLITFQSDELKLTRLPNSVDTLAPNNRFVRNINTFPLKSGIPYHTIIGDRGKGGNKDQTKPCSTDGIVPYWSSHLDDAQSELVVPSNHGAHQHPQAIAEVRRILLEHARR